MSAAAAKGQLTVLVRLGSRGRLRNERTHPYVKCGANRKSTRIVAYAGMARPHLLL